MNDLLKKARIMTIDKISINIAFHQVITNAKKMIDFFQKSSKHINQSTIPNGIKIEYFLDSEITEQDRIKIINTLHIFIEETKLLFGGSTREQITDFDTWKQGNGCYLILTDNEKIIGILHGGPSRYLPYTSFIDRTAIDNDYRGQGRGGLLKTRFGSIAKSLWGSVYLLSAVGKNNIPSIRCNQKAGFHKSCTYIDPTDGEETIEFGKFI